MSLKKYNKMKLKLRVVQKLSLTSNKNKRIKFYKNNPGHQIQVNKKNKKERKMKCLEILI